MFLGSRHMSNGQARIKGGAKGAAAPGPAALRGPHFINMCVVDHWLSERAFGR